MWTAKFLAAAGALLLSVMVSVAAAGPPTLSGTDYAEINALYSRYAYAFDSSDAEMFASVFTPDGEFVIGPRTTEGSTALKAMASGRGPKKERPKIFHLTMNVLITPTAVGASGSAYVVTVDLAKNPAISGGGVYEDVIVKTAEATDRAIRCLRNMDPGFHEHAVEVIRLENSADNLLRDSLAALFDEGGDPIEVIKWKEIYETMEIVTDRCEDVANVIEGIILKMA